MDICNKIYVVVAVLTLILVGIFLYLVFMERKVRRLENALKEKDMQNKDLV
jgi:regulatory protein YycI of two-component signal transduction system YycFG